MRRIIFLVALVLLSRGILFSQDIPDFPGWNTINVGDTKEKVIETLNGKFKARFKIQNMPNEIIMDPILYPEKEYYYRLYKISFLFVAGKLETIYINPYVQDQNVLTENGDYHIIRSMYSDLVYIYGDPDIYPEMEGGISLNDVNIYKWFFSDTVVVFIYNEGADYPYILISGYKKNDIFQ